MLTINEKVALEAAAGGRVSAIAVAQLVLAAAGATTWEPGFEGAIVLHTTDGASHVSMFEFGDDLTEIFWVGSIELYPQMQYTALLPVFHVFEIGDGALGLNFSDAGEARTFSASLQQLVVAKVTSVAANATPIIARPPPRPAKPPAATDDRCARAVVLPSSLTRFVYPHQWTAPPACTTAAGRKRGRG